MRRSRQMVVVGSLALGCSTVDSSVGLLGTQGDGADSASSTSGQGPPNVGTTRASAADGGSDNEGDGTLKLDVAAPDGGADACVGERCDVCNAVDLLFVIDNSSSMNSHQEALTEAFPSFADVIVEALPPDVSLHVGVTSTTMGDSNSGSTENCVATGDGGLPVDAFYITPDMTNTGVNGAQGRLYEAAGQPYFELNTSAGPDELDALSTWFSAAATIGESGSQIEMSAAGAGWAADPANDATNAGFIRDEGAVLVVFFIQDEPDQTPRSAAADLVAKLEAAKAGCGGMECVVGGGFVNQMCLSEAPLGVLFDSLGAPPVVEQLPFVGGDPGVFVPVLSETLAQVIVQTCEQIIPG